MNVAPWIQWMGDVLISESWCMIAAEHVELAASTSSTFFPMTFHTHSFYTGLSSPPLWPSQPSSPSAEGNARWASIEEELEPKVQCHLAWKTSHILRLNFPCCATLLGKHQHLADDVSIIWLDSLKIWNWMCEHCLRGPFCVESYW